MNNLPLNNGKEDQSLELYKELHQKVKNIFGIKLPDSFDDFKMLDRSYILDTFGGYFMDRDQKKSDLAKEINNFFKQYADKNAIESKAIDQTKKEIHDSWEIPFPGSYIGYKRLINTKLKIILPSHKKNFTQEIFENLLLLFDKQDGSYESRLIDHGNIFLKKNIDNDLPNKQELINPEVLQIEKKDEKKEKTVRGGNTVVDSKKEELIRKKYHQSGEEIKNVIQEINHSDSNCVSVSDYKILKLFLEALLSRSNKKMSDVSLQSGVMILEDALSKNTFWQSSLQPYIIDGKINLQKIKKDLSSPYYQNSNIYRYIMSFKVE